MKRIHIFTLAGAAALAMTSSAWANTLSSFFLIDFIDSSPPTGYRIHTSITTNPAGCANLGHLDPNPNVAAERRALSDKLLLSAFLAGRKVRLEVSSSTCSSDGYPTYNDVQLNKDQ